MMATVRVQPPAKTPGLAISDSRQLMFGKCPNPVTCGFDLVIGNGTVFPEINFTLPQMTIEQTTWRNVTDHYREIGEAIVSTARRLRIPGIVVEFELLPPMTENPAWGAEVTRILSDRLRRGYEEDGLHSALRVTPVDIRDIVRPPNLRSGKEWDLMRRSFDQCARAGAHILSIESVGGKEVHDEALMYGDIAGIVFALGVLAPRDMEFLWRNILRTCREYGIVAGGDSACGFANTAMQLASQSLLPEVIAAIDRGASAVRSLVAVECGAIGPSKDCAYEGPILKAITGIPISMEGKSASCAHFSPVGNIAGAMCDLWSNESVQNIRLLSGSAPEAFLELLAYDCRLYNNALNTGRADVYRAMLVESDVRINVQALVLSPESTVRIADAIVSTTGHYRKTVAAALECCTVICEALEAKQLELSRSEMLWLKRTEESLQSLPENEDSFIASMMSAYGHLIDPSSYGL
ncbi:MAG TPA: methyltransferase MtaB domain-containing protein [Bacteroidota bacterium]